MAFPTSPTNGQTVVVNNVSYRYSNVSNSWTRILSTANIITANTLVSNGYISAAGNISTGNYFIGNGSLLTGISINPSAITNGTSNVSVVSSGGNVAIGIGGTGNVAVFATTGEYVTGVISASGNITSAANITGGNILTAGLISVTGTLSVSGVTTLANLSAGNVSSGGITSGGAVSAAGNITGGNLSGTNIVGTLTTAAQTNITSVGTLGSLAVTANITGGNILTGGLISATANVTANNGMFTNIVNVASHTGAVVSVSGNVTGGNLLTGGLISATSTITSAANVTGGNLTTAGLVTATGNIISVANVSGGNILTAGLMSSTGNAIHGNILTSGLISSTGNVVSAGNIIASKIVSATDNIVINSTGGEGGQIILGWTGISNITGQANSTWNLDVDASNNWRAFYQNAAGAAQVLISANSTSNIVSFPQTAGISATGNVTGNYFIGNGSQLTGIAASYGNANVVANLAALGSNPVSTTGNVTGGNFLTGGLISAVANVTAPYFIGNGAALTGLSASKIFNGTSEANIGASGGNANITIGGTSNVFVVATTGIYTTGLSSVSGNVTGGNLLTGGLVSAAGTITGTSHLGSVVSVTANVTGGNLLTAGLISATANITGNYFIGNGSALTGIASGTPTKIVNGTSEANIGASGGNANITIGGTSNVVVVATSGLYVSGLMSSTGNAVHSNVIINGTAAAGSGVLIVSGNIQTSTSNATANIGNASNYFNRLFAQATTALYADLAEVYRSDAQYPPGTVLVFGGNQEVTMSTVTHDTKIAGIVSTNPAHVMNSGMTSEFTVEVGLIGRVPCRVIGPIAAGDQVVSSNRAGVAERLDQTKYRSGMIIGKALESYSSTEPGTIEVVVGRL